MTDRAATGLRPPRRAGWAGGFTLMEMIVVIGLIALAAAMTLPSIYGLYNAGADSQAYNLVASQLTSARALAIERGTYAGVRFQLADATIGGVLVRPELQNVCFSAIVLYDRQTMNFRVHGAVERIPGTIVFGKIAGTTVQGSDYSSGVNDLSEFTTFMVVFSPSGSVVKLVEGRNPTMNPSDPAFVGVTSARDDAAGYAQIWTMRPDRPGVTALTMFDIAEYLSAANKASYLNQNGQFLPLNVNTGQLYRRE